VRAPRAGPRGRLPELHVEDETRHRALDPARRRAADGAARAGADAAPTPLRHRTRPSRGSAQRPTGPVAGHAPRAPARAPGRAQPVPERMAPTDKPDKSHAFRPAPIHTIEPPDGASKRQARGTAS